MKNKRKTMIDFKKLQFKRFRAVLEKHFQLPFHFDNSYCILDDRNNMVFECATDLNNSNYGHLKNLMLRVVAKINGESDDFLLSSVSYPYLYVDGEKLLEVRGWGWLTAPQCEGLSDLEAADFQQDVLRVCEKILGTI